MRARVLPFLVGFMTAAVLAILLTAVFLAPRLDPGAFETGRRCGIVEAHSELLPRIQKMLGDDYLKSDGYQTIFEVKADAVVVVERNGVKTLRVYRMP